MAVTQGRPKLPWHAANEPADGIVPLADMSSAKRFGRVIALNVLADVPGLSQETNGAVFRALYRPHRKR